MLIMTSLHHHTPSLSATLSVLLQHNRLCEDVILFILHCIASVQFGIEASPQSHGRKGGKGDICGSVFSNSKRVGAVISLEKSRECPIFCHWLAIVQEGPQKEHVSGLRAVERNLPGQKEDVKGLQNCELAMAGRSLLSKR